MILQPFHKLELYFDRVTAAGPLAGPPRSLLTHWELRQKQRLQCKRDYTVEWKG